MRASSGLDADTQTLLLHIAACWGIEVLFGDGKEELRLDHYQVISATALVRFWMLAMLTKVILRKNGSARPKQEQRPITLVKSDGNSSGICGATSCSGCIRNSNWASNLTPCMTCSSPEAARLKSAKIEKR